MQLPARQRKKETDLQKENQGDKQSLIFLFFQTNNSENVGIEKV